MTDEVDGYFPELRLLGIDGAPDDRALLGLPGAGALKSGQIEAALERRLDEVARHPLSESPAANRLRAHLESAADRLQAALALDGRGPLHPNAARRAGRRIAVRSAREAREHAPVVAPTALRRTGSGLSADDLTEFDRLALAVLVVSGGWNARSAKRLAIVAEDHGVSVSDLHRVVRGLTRFLAEGDGLRGAMGEVGAQARTTYLAPRPIGRIDAAEGVVERVFERIDEVLRREVGGGSSASQWRLAVVFGLFALSWVGVLAVVFFGGGGAGDGGAQTAGVGEEPAPWVAGGSSTEPAAAGQDGTDAAAARRIGPLAAPAKYPRPPGFVPSATPRGVVEEGAKAAEWIARLEAFRASVRLADGRPALPALADLGAALSSAAQSWPASGAYRQEFLAILAETMRELRGGDLTREAMRLMPGDEQAGGPAEPWRASWRAAFGAGCLAVIALDPSQPPEVAAAAREELRTRRLPIPRGVVADPFAAGAASVLARDAARLADGLAIGTLDLESASRWAEAVEAILPSVELRNRLAMSAIDAALRAPGAIDAPGPLVDFLAWSIHTLDFTGRGRDPEAVRDALGAWIADAAIPPARIWAFTSLLDQDLGIAWYGPEFILPTDGSAGVRAALAERVVAAFPRLAATTAGEAVLVEKSLHDDWLKQAASIRPSARTDAAAQLRSAAVALAVFRTAVVFASGDEKAARRALDAAQSLIGRAEGEWTASPTGERAGLPASGVGDGDFAAELAAAGRDAARRLQAIRALEMRPAAGDLGPIDARALAFEALRGTQPEPRGRAATALAERFARGPTVLRAVLDQLVDAGGPEAAEAVSRLLGEVVSGRGWQAAARERVLERIFRLEDGVRHEIDLAAAEIALAAAELAPRFDRSVAPLANARAEDALARLADAMRSEAEGRFLAQPFPATAGEIERQRTARRSIARTATQRMAAESAGIVDYAALLVVARQPALRAEIESILLENRRARAGVPSASAQLAGDLETVVRIMGKGLAPRPTERSAG